MRVRRVVTGQNGSGKSVLISDEQLAPATAQLLPGGEFFRLWADDGTPALPSDGTPTVAVQHFPPTGGFRFYVISIPPDTVTPPADLDMAAAVAEAGEKFPGLLDVMEPDHPGMHTTDTVDVLFVLAGAVTLELDDGVEVELRAGDSVVQHGARHAWRNRGDAPVVLAVGQVGGKRDASG